jgi:hypothetical protein
MLLKQRYHKWWHHSGTTCAVIIASLSWLKQLDEGGSTGSSAARMQLAAAAAGRCMNSLVQSPQWHGIPRQDARRLLPQPVVQANATHALHFSADGS